MRVHACVMFHCAFLGWRGGWGQDFTDLDRPMSRAQQAAWMVEDAMRGLEPLDFHPSDLTRRMRETYLFQMQLEYYLYTPLVVCALVLTMFEVPLWCDNGAWWAWASKAEDQCPTADGSHAYFSKLPYLPKGWASLAELVIVLLLSLIVGWQSRMSVTRRESLKIAERVRTVIVVLMAVDFVVFFMLNHVYDFNVCFRFAPFLRVGVFFCQEKMTPALINVWKM